MPAQRKRGRGGEKIGSGKRACVVGGQGPARREFKAAINLRTCESSQDRGPFIGKQNGARMLLRKEETLVSAVAVRQIDPIILKEQGIVAVSRLRRAHGNVDARRGRVGLEIQILEMNLPSSEN